MADEESCFVVHGHFYQPPRESPWTEEVPREPSAAPFHDWNARITSEAYRPNGFARIVDDAGRVVDIVNNYGYMSFNVGPTLFTWLERHANETYHRILAGEAEGGGAIAQAYGHIILPLANDRDIRTQIRWGLADFDHRFGRPATGMWLPECAVNDRVLEILAEEDVAFTVLAPGQAEGGVDTTRLHRWVHPDGERSVALVFYDGGLSHDAAFGLGALTSEALVDRVASGHGLVTLAADGETFGHHHNWGDRLLAYALAVEAPARRLPVRTLNDYVAAQRKGARPVEVKESSWSCAHGVARWREDCGCSTGGDPGWNQRWRTPLREALDRLRDGAIEVFERRGAAVLRDPWAARDAYIDVLLGRRTADDFGAEHVTGDRVEAFTLLESQRHAMSMYTSCGWFFNDIAGIETQQVLRYAARVVDLLGELGEDPGVSEFLTVLEKAESNDPSEGTGRAIWDRHVVPSRVDARRTAGHLALFDLFERRSPRGPAGGFAIEVSDHERAERGPLTLSTGTLALTHLRTGRRHHVSYAALHLGGLEVVGAVTKPVAKGEPWRIRHSFARGAPVTELLRDVYAGTDSWEFGLGAALPEAAEELLEGVARSLANRFAQAFDRLFEDHRATLLALADAGYPLPAELRAPGELALARRLEIEVAAQSGALDPAAYASAIAIARQARDSGLRIDTPEARATVDRLLLRATHRALSTRASEAIDAAIAVLLVADELGFSLNLDRPQELVKEAIGTAPPAPPLARLAEALHLAI